MLRDYQQAAVDAVVAHCATSSDPAVVVMATGAGKSHVVAELARIFGRGLVLAPTKELVKQDREKFEATGNACTTFCASLGAKDATGRVVFGSPQSVRNSVADFDFFDAVFIDECHRGQEEAAAIIDTLRKQNPDLRVVGFTATPFILGRGRIYRVAHDGTVLTDEEALRPYYGRCVYEIGANELIERGFLTPPTLIPTNLEYDTNNLVLSRGRYTAESVAETFTGKTTLTRRIVGEVIRRSVGRRGVMVFCASVDHAQEVMTYLPKGQARIVTADTPPALRDQYVAAFRCGMFRYLVNVAIFTTGFDVAHVDHIAILRKTESASLWQQIVGRGTRLYDGKDDFLISDFAGNIDAFFGDDIDIFSPVVRSRRSVETEKITVECPTCAHPNKFSAIPNPNKLSINKMGQYLDLAGDVIYHEDKPIPAHYGRACQNHFEKEGKLTQCSHRWQGKNCKRCGHENDISARKCQCGAQLVDWNKQLSFIAGSRNFVEADHGYKMARCTDAKISSTWINSRPFNRVDFYIEGRKTPLTKHYNPNSQDWDLFKARAAKSLPEFVLWKQGVRKGTNSVRLRWQDAA